MRWVITKKRERGVQASVLTGALALTVAVTGCSSSSGGKDGELGGLDRDEKGTLKIGYFDEQAFYMQYGNAFAAMFPNVELEVIPTDSALNADDPVTEIEKLMAEQQPDAILLSEDQYAALAEKGLLYDLDAAVKQDNYDLEAFLPSVIDLLKVRGGGKLYGLSPTFSNQALYYNKDLFDKYGIPYPTDGMSWDEVLQLAARFPAKKGSGGVKMGEVGSDDALYGLMQPMQAANSFELIRTIGEAKGLLYADSETGTVSIDTPEWKAIVESVVDGYESGSISSPGSSGGSGGGPGGGQLMIRGAGGRTAFSFGPDSMRFMAGQAAMSVDGPMVMNMLGISQGGAGVVTKAGTAAGTAGGNAAGTKGQTLKAIGQDLNWDVVTLPADPSQPDATGSMSLDNIFAINASSGNLPAAWEFLKYATGEQLAKTGAKSSPTLTSRTDYKPDGDGRNLDAFYSEHINEQSLLQEESLPDGFADSFAELAAAQIDNAAAGTQTVEEALQTIQSQGQDLLTKAMADEEQQ